MIAMIFEFWMDMTDEAMVAEYHTTSSRLREVLDGIDGFAGVERFESCAEPGKFVAVGFFTNEAAVADWRNTPAHRTAQELGRTRFFADYRLRMATVNRDYGPGDRAQAPDDSNHHHLGAA